MLPPAVALFSALLKQDNHEVKLFDTTYWEYPTGGGIDNEKYKEAHLHVRPYEPPKKTVPLYTTNVYEAFNQVVAEFEPHLIACSATEDLFPYAIQFLQNLHTKGQAKTLVGGIFATFAAEKVIQYPEIDMVCLGEGEYPLLELCNRLARGQSYADIANLWVKQDGVVVKNHMTYLTDIDQLPLMDLGLFEESRYYRPFDGKVYRTFPVETHRGCPYRCTYCNSPAKSKLYRAANLKFFRIKSIENLRRELLFYKQTGQAEYLYFWADTFLASPHHYLEELVEMYSSEIGLPFWCQTRPETLTERRVQLLKKMGIHRMGIGLEHGNPQFREQILGRSVSNQLIINSLHRLADYDIKFSINNIIGFPTETRALAFDTIRLNRQLPADTRNMYTFTPFHGTPLRQMAEAMGYLEPNTIATSLTQPTLLNMPQFPKAAIEGVRRCFVPYVLLEPHRWSEIELAEQLTPAGDRVWEQIMAECRERFFATAEVAST